MNSGLSKEKELIFDIAKKIESDLQKLSRPELTKYLNLSVEACSLICQRTINPNEKEYYFNVIKILNDISKEFNIVLLEKYLRIILMNANNTTVYFYRFFCISNVFFFFKKKSLKQINFKLDLKQNHPKSLLQTLNLQQ